MNNFIQNYQQQKEKLLTAFDILSDNGFIPFHSGKLSFEQKDIIAFKNNLAKNKFYVSICGQIKSGKSTFLNFMLFNEREVLPADPTPWTAKLTKISYGEEEYANIHFYSSAEWDELENLVIRDDEKETEINYYREYLQDAVEESAKNGIHRNGLVMDTPMVKRLNNLQELDAYISSQGLYTPFVSEVELYTNNPMLKDVIIVDTPGINDANQLRSKVAIDFINHSSAVVYLFYASKPFGAADLHFIDDYLYAIPSSKIVFTASRCDLAKSEQSVVAYIENLFKTLPELQERHFTLTGNVIAFSTLAALVKYKTDHGIPLTMDEQYHKKKLRVDLIEKSGYWNELMAAIGEHIMNDKGKDVLNAAVEKLRIIADGRIDGVLSEINILEQSLKDLLLSKNELNEKIRTVGEIAKNINGQVEHFDERKNELFNQIEDDLRSRRVTVEQMARVQFETWLSVTKTRKALRISAHELRNVLRRSIDEHFSQTIADNYFNTLQHAQTEVKDTIASETQELFVENKWKKRFKPLIPVNRLIDNAFVVMGESTNRFVYAKETKYWGLAVDRDATIANLEHAGAVVIGDVMSKLSTSMIMELQKEIEKYSGDLKDEITTRLNIYINRLSELKENFSDKAGNEQKINEQLNHLRAEAARLEVCWNEIRLQSDI